MPAAAGGGADGHRPDSESAGAVRSPSAPTETQEAVSTPTHRRRWPWIAAGVIVALVVVLGAATALTWRYSNEVLVPQTFRPSFDVTVEAVGPHRVVLERTDESERPGLYGIEWPAGHAIAGPVLHKSDDAVTRRLTQVRGYLVSGMEVGIDWGTYSGDPREALGLPYETVRVRSDAGAMPDWVIPSATQGGSRTWAIVVHGINGTLMGGLQIVPPLRARGLTSMLITYRGDDGAPDGPDGLHHLGLTEWRDVAAAARYALAHGARRLVLVGYSMGGALVTQFMERSPLASGWGR